MTLPREAKVFARPLLAIAILFETGCALQLSGGTTSATPDTGERKVYASTAIQTQNIRANGSLVGLRATWLGDAAGVRVRNAILGFGYDLNSGIFPLGIEGAAELGAGGSALARFDGIGMYTGVSASPRLRILGRRDRQSGFNLVLTYMDVVATGRAGFWAPPENPEHHRSYGEWALELGVRFSIASDALNAPSQSVTTEPVPEGAK